MYRDLKCQHHFVQERNDQRPDIPGLTAIGFERWMTLLIQAYPEEEYRRLQRAVLDMPISNPDQKERFPKDIPRRLFPQIEERGIREHVENTIVKHVDIQIPSTLSRKEPQSDGDTLCHTSKAGKQQCNPPNYNHRRVSFILPPNSRSNTPQRFDKPTYEDVEKTRRKKRRGCTEIPGKTKTVQGCQLGREEAPSEILTDLAMAVLRVITSDENRLGPSNPELLFAINMQSRSRLYRYLHALHFLHPIALLWLWHATIHVNPSCLRVLCKVLAPLTTCRGFLGPLRVQGCHRTQC